MPRRRTRAETPKRNVDYRNLTSPFPVMTVFSDDQIESIHNSALRLLEETGLKVLLPEARELFGAAGARVDAEDEMVWLGREIVAEALKTAPREIRTAAGAPDRDVTLALGNIVFQPGAGAPHAADLQRGRRPGSLSDFKELVQLTQSFDVLHVMPPLVEPQDVPLHVRHYDMTRWQMALTDKVPFVYARGRGQVEECFEMLSLFRGLDADTFKAQARCYTVINTNSPRQIDVPMAQGIIDFARWGQVAFITPFTLMGAMAPVSIAGAMVLSHAEALAAITLAQLAKPGAPVCYGTFTSNVDMKSGAPIFGTPEHFKASLAAGQLARRIGLPWRCASGTAAATPDVQAANETQFGTWGCLLAGASVILHSAGWLEGGLTVSYEKLITDLEVLQEIAELCSPTEVDLAMDALADVDPGGHFFGAGHTMERYQTAFYDPLNADFSNFGTWHERGAQDATQRATDLWQKRLEAFEAPPIDLDRLQMLDDWIAVRSAAGGCAPES
ncbi:MAG: trimethylamine methyltransferase family protein [Pseudomonadota bacterium]